MPWSCATSLNRGAAAATRRQTQCGGTWLSLLWLPKLEGFTPELVWRALQKKFASLSAAKGGDNTQERWQTQGGVSNSPAQLAKGRGEPQFPTDARFAQPKCCLKSQLPGSEKSLCPVLHLSENDHASLLSRLGGKLGRKMLRMP